MALALQALWKGLLYHADTLTEALRLAPHLNHADALSLREQVARDGLAAPHEGVNVLALAKETVRLARVGLKEIAPDEVSYLDILRQQVIEEELAPADILLRNWHGSWHGSMSRVFEYLRIA
jgi:glutamate--cysteine ligase